ncbi:MAG: adenosylhomocysteinase [Chloroflexota bacterium]|nr:adenosylhomocysteinase [Chloroflexota bacterium]
MTTTENRYDVKDLAQARAGHDRIAWAERDMPVLRQVRERFEKERPFEGVRFAACLHVTTETANLLLALQAGGAEVAVCASNPLSTQDDVAAALVESGIAAYAVKGEDADRYYSHIESVLATRPNITMDDGADLVSTLHLKHTELLPEVAGGTEETTTGVNRLKVMAAEGELKFPIVAVNEAHTKHMFDNRYGTGQSTLDGILRATNRLLAGRTFVVAGYGWCGKGIASRARGLGSQVVVTEIDPVRALEAVMDGFRVMPMSEAARIADVIVTVTGGLHAIGADTIANLKDGAMLANSGHFNDEIDIPALERLSTAKRTLRPFVDEYEFADGRKVILIAEGRLVNLGAAEGHPASVMDMSFANQALSAEWVLKNHRDLRGQVYDVPSEIDRDVARLKLESLGVRIDALSSSQQAYASEWRSGT